MQCAYNWDVSVVCPVRRHLKHCCNNAGMYMCMCVNSGCCHTDVNLIQFFQTEKNCFPLDTIKMVSSFSSEMQNIPGSSFLVL